jgi:putative DNA primase/helicase
MSQQHEPESPAAAFSLVDKADWNQRLIRAPSKDPEKLGPILPVLENLVAILANDERWEGVIARDMFSDTIVKRQPPPTYVSELGEWMDEDDHRLEFWLADTYSLRRIPSNDLMKAVFIVADKNRFHEVRDFLATLTWDGKPRLKDWLTAFLGAEQSEYHELVAVKYLVQAVARIYKPGIKADYVIILEGAQGIGKSSTFRILFDPWFTDAAFDLGDTQEAGQIIRGMWGVELPELDSMRRADHATAKAFFSRDRDRYRNPYGRKPVTVLRQQVFGGSVNHFNYMTDDTGNRRYWPVRVAMKWAIDLDGLKAARDQLLAEAVAEYKKGTPWHVRAQEKQLFDEAQEERYQGDAYETRIRSYLERPNEVDGPLQQVKMNELLGRALGLDTSKWTRAEQTRVGNIMLQRLCWTQERETVGTRERYYARPAQVTQ